MEQGTEIIKYLYIDDRKKGRLSVQNFRIDGKLSIDTILPTEKRIDIIKELRKYNGLIVDQQLDEVTIDNKFKSDYLGSSLAMDIRTKENEISIIKNEDISIPIILFSANENVPRTIYGLGEEIFDLKIYKSEASYMEFESKIPMYQKQMISLVNGYNILKKLKKDKRSICEGLQLDDNLDKIDSRFLDELKKRESYTAHSSAMFILNELIIKQGILIDEDVLAVRLGIDKKESQDSWIKVLDSLKNFGANYRGVFYDGWSRWWMPMVDKWWSEIIGEESYLQFLSASERKSIISKKLNIHLKTASAKSRFSISDDYWTVCDSSKEPLSIENGLMLPGQDNLYPWQDARYVSIMSAIEESLDIADFENERLEYYKTILNQLNNDNR